MGTGREGPLKFPGTLPPRKKTMGGHLTFEPHSSCKKQRFIASAREKNIRGHLLDHFLFFELQTLHCSDLEFQAVNNFPVKQRMLICLMVWYVLITKVLAGDFCDWLFTLSREEKMENEKNIQGREIFGMSNA